MELKDSETQQSQVQIRIISEADDFDRFSALLNLGFAVPEGSQFFDDFPIWGPKRISNEITRIGLFFGKKLCCSTGIRIAHLKTVRGLTSKIAIIGAVATHPSVQGQGLGSHLVEIAIEWAKQEGATIVLLWGSAHALYQRLGFELCGRQVRIPLSRLEHLGMVENAANQVQPENQRINTGWNPQLFPLIQKREGGLILNDEDRVWFEAHGNVQWFYTGTPEQPTAYAALGRGIDLKNLVHEWSGSPHLLGFLFRAIMSKYPGAELLASPGHLNSLGILDGNLNEEFLCMAKLLDMERLLRDYELDYSHMIESDPQLAAELASIEKGKLGGQLFRKDGLFSLPLWIWGLDAA